MNSKKDSEKQVAFLPSKVLCCRIEEISSFLDSSLSSPGKLPSMETKMGEDAADQTGSMKFSSIAKGPRSNPSEPVLFL